MIHFQELRDNLMLGLDCDRRMATLVIRIHDGIDDFDDFDIIEKCSGFHNKPLLSDDEKRVIKHFLKL